MRGGSGRIDPGRGAIETRPGRTHRLHDFGRWPSGGNDGRSGRTAYPHPRFSDRLRDGSLDRFAQGPTAERLRLSEQFEARSKGDIARRLELSHHFEDRHGPGRPGGPNALRTSPIRNSHDGYHGSHAGRARPAHYHAKYPHWQRHYHGRVSPRFTVNVVVHRYPGYRWYAGPVYYPRWNPWVSWSWRYRSHPYYDPRPVWCRPVVYAAAPVWVWWEPPVWRPLPVVAAGTWVDVAPIEIPAAQYDLQLLAVRMVDPGHPQEQLGPRYRVWFRNNSADPITNPFSVVLLAGDDAALTEGLPQAGVEVTAMEAGDTQSVDIRLPYDVMTMARDTEGHPAPFATLHVLLDAHRTIDELDEENNGATLAADDILLVDPALFAADPGSAAPGGEITLAGEGLGPVPGQVLVYVGGREMEGEIVGWYDLGVQFNLPNVALAGPTQAEIVVVRSDGAASNPLPITLAP